MGDDPPRIPPVHAAAGVLRRRRRSHRRLWVVRHWHRCWFSTAARTGTNPQPAGNPSPFEPFGTWADRNAPGDNSPDPGVVGKVDDSFPKGKAMKEWLVNVGASTTPGDIDIKESKRATAVEYLSFNTPITVGDDQKCGRVVYSDLHVSSGDVRGPPPVK